MFERFKKNKRGNQNNASSKAPASDYDMFDEDYCPP